MFCSKTNRSPVLQLDYILIPKTTTHLVLFPINLRSKPRVYHSERHSTGDSDAFVYGYNGDHRQSVGKLHS